LVKTNNDRIGLQDYSKDPGPLKIPPRGGGPGFGYPQRGFAILEVSKIANIKLQISNKLQ